MTKKEIMQLLAPFHDDMPIFFNDDDNLLYHAKFENYEIILEQKMAQLKRG